MSLNPTPRDILDRWLVISPVLGKLSAYYTLIRIAAAGSAGIDISRLRALTQLKGLERKTLRKWEKAGLITCLVTPGGYCCRSIITEKGLRLLRLAPETNPIDGNAPRRKKTAHTHS